MKKTLAVLFTFLITSVLAAQTASIITPSQSKYGYPWSALAGSQRNVYVTPIAESDYVTHLSGDGTTVTVTAINTLEAGDVINFRNFSAPGQNYSWGVFKVTSATPTSFTFSDSWTGSVDETTGYVQKIEGPHWTGDGKWEIYTTTGTETFRLYTQDGSQDTGLVTHPVLNSAPSHVNFEVGPNAGVTSTTGSITTSNFAIHSTIEFDIKFTLAADPTKTSIMHYVVAANGGGYPYQGVARVAPGYRQVFKNRYIPLAGQVFGNTNQMMDWTITEAPAGADATLQFATFPQPVFYSGSVPGQYEVTACPHVDASAGACDKLAIWVSPNDPPAANHDKVEQTPCDVDTVANPNVFEVGPSKAHTDLLSFPQSYAGPMLLRIYNEGPAGSPTEYHNQIQINLPSSGTWDDRHPAFVMCGVPNPTTGELPIIDGSNATAAPWASGYIVAPYGLIGFGGIAGGTDIGGGMTINDGLVKPFNHVLISGIHIRNVIDGYNYTDPAGNPGTWGGSMGVRPNGIQYFSMIGTYAENVATPYYDDCNTQQSGWKACSLDNMFEGNHAIGYGTNGHSTEHMFYLQAFRDTVMLNLQDGSTNGSGGTSAYSDRGTRTFHMYNRLVPKPGYTTGSGPGGHSEIQDAFNYILPDEYWGYQGAPDCNTTYSNAAGCSGAFGGEDWFAAVTEEHSNSEFTIGNAYESDCNGCKFLGIATTHNTVGIDNSSQGFYGYNTFYVTPTALSYGQSFFEDTRLNGQDNDSLPYLPANWPRAFIQNNIIPWLDTTNCGYTCTVFGLYGHALMSFQTNMVTPGQVTINPNILPTGWQAGGIFRDGINTAYNFMDGWSLTPINRNLDGFTAPNFIAYTSFPIDTTTLAPQSGSDAIGKASAPTGQLAYYPPRFNAVTDLMTPFQPRQDLTTLGAYDPANPPTPYSFAVTPNPLTLLTSRSAVLSCKTTMTDSSVRDCFSYSCTSTNTGSATVSGLTVTATNNPGSGYLACTADGLSEQDVPFSVVPPPPSGFLGTGTYVGTGILQH